MPTSPELEEKRRLVEKLKGEKAAREKAIRDLENSLKAQRQDILAALHYLDKLAKEHQAKLPSLKALNTPEAQAEIKSIEAKLAVYQTVRAAASRFEETMGTGNLQTFTSTALSLRFAEAEAVLANAKMVLGDLAKNMDILRQAAGKTGMLVKGPPPPPIVAQIRTRVKASPGLTQSINAALHFYEEASQATAMEESNLMQLRAMQGKEAVQFAANKMKISNLAGKINNLRSLHQTFAHEPLLKQLFPEPFEVEIPRLPPGMTGKKEPMKPLTGILKELLGFNKNK